MKNETIEKPSVVEDKRGTSGSEEDLKDMDMLFSAILFCLKGDELLGDFFDDIPSDENEHVDFDKAIIEIQRLKTKGWCLDNGYDSKDYKKLWEQILSKKFQNDLREPDRD